jgi:hypothetical protein
MGVLADFFVARESRAEGYDSNPDGFTHRASYKNITPLELSTLWAAISGSESTPGLADEFRNVLTKDGGERLIYRFPSKLVTQLADLKSESIGPIAATWATTDDELKMFCQSSADLEPLVADLARLARHAAELQSDLYLWICV